MVNEYRALALQRWRPCNMVWVILCDEIILNVTIQYKWTCREIKIFPTIQCTLCWTVVFLCMLEYWIATAWYLYAQKGGNFAQNSLQFQKFNGGIGYLFAHFRSKSVSRYARLAKIGLRNIHRQYFSYLFDPFYVERNFVELIFHWIANRLNLCAKLPLFASRGNNSVDTIIIHTQHAINTFNAQSLLAKVAAIKRSYSFVHTLY